MTEYFPALHAVHAKSEVAPAVSKNLPVRQATQVSPDVAFCDVEYLPATHGVHVYELDAPRTEEYVPAPQGSHIAPDAAPIASE